MTGTACSHSFSCLLQGDSGRLQLTSWWLGLGYQSLVISLTTMMSYDGLGHVERWETGALARRTLVVFRLLDDIFRYRTL